LNGPDYLYFKILQDKIIFIYHPQKSALLINNVAIHYECDCLKNRWYYQGKNQPEYQLK
jgi:hypothetical protein